MSETINQMEVSEFKELIYATVKQALLEILEENEALQSKNFLLSVNEARENYRKGEYVALEDLDV
ncbi:MAG: hypothetical protein A2X64_02820 [Ignavibacteria bacterium GWF2_33_9]|nr:MAG: hypothetical protein A2X64_02820 [Ignavibacteria bacterium GWF2_33_9]